MNPFFARGGLWAASLLCSALAPAAPPPAAAADPIRFTTWNLRNYRHSPPASGQPGAPKPAPERQAIVSILRHIRPDILGLCEMGSAADLALLQQALQAAGLPLPHAELVAASDPDRHLALLSRFPLSARQPVTHLRYLLDNREFPVQRGFLDATVAVSPTYSLRLVGAHLKSRRDVPEADQDLMRRNEAHLLRQHLDGILASSPSANLLVYGDFNDARDQPSFKAIKGLRGTPGALTEIAAADPSGHRWTYYFPQADEYSRIDFVLASAPLLPEMQPDQSFLYGGQDWLQASDHRPVTAVILPQDAPRRPRPPQPSSDP